MDTPVYARLLGVFLKDHRLQFVGMYLSSSLGVCICLEVWNANDIYFQKLLTGHHNGAGTYETDIKLLIEHLNVILISMSRRMAQLLCCETSCFEPSRSGFTRVQFPVKVKL